MHVISYRKIREFATKHADSRQALDDWYRIANKAQWYNLIDVQKVFPSAEAVGSFTVFNIKGNNYRLIVSIDYSKQRIFIKYVLTHAEYDKEKQLLNHEVNWDELVEQRTTITPVQAEKLSDFFGVNTSLFIDSR